MVVFTTDSRFGKYDAFPDLCVYFFYFSVVDDKEL